MLIIYKTYLLSTKLEITISLAVIMLQSYLLVLSRFVLYAGVLTYRIFKKYHNIRF